MSWVKIYRKSAIIVGATLLLPAVLVLYFFIDFLVLRQEYQGEIDRLQPRVARMAGLIESEELLRVSAAQLESQVSNLVYPPSEDSATVSATLQTDIREIMTEAGLTVTNSRILPVIEEEAFDRIGLSLSVSGGLDALDAALIQIANYTPRLLIDSMVVKPRRVSRSADNKSKQIVSASFQFLALRAI